LDNALWTIDHGGRVNFWNDLLCSSKCISLLRGITPQERITLTCNVVEGWNGSSWDLSYNMLQHIQLQTLYHLTTTDISDSPNWKLEDNGILNQKAAKYFISTHPTCDWSKIIWSNSICPTKILVF